MTENSASNPDNFLVAHGEWYEDMLLACLINDLTWFKEVEGVLCVETQTQPGKKFSKSFPVNDFSSYWRHVAYQVVKDYNSVFVMSGVPFSRMPLEVAGKFMHTYASEGRLLTENEIPDMLSRLEDLMRHDTTKLLPTVRGYFGSWLKRRRLINAGVTLTKPDGFGNRVNAVLSGIKRTVNLLDSIRPVKEEKHFHVFGEGMDSEKPAVQRFPSITAKLDHRLGGGFARGESTLVIAGTGVGKTVLACQTAQVFALGGLKGVLISTEQRHDALEMRFLSSYCGIPFDEIKDGVSARDFENSKKFTYEQKKMYRDMRRHLGNRLAIFNWCDAGDSIVEKMPETIEEVKGAFGGLDFIILDWIGGGLGQIDTSRPEILRLLYQNTADYMAALAEDENIITISFTQAHADKSSNKLKVDSTCVAECKSMGRKMTNIIGITGFQNFRGKRDDVDLNGEEDKNQFTNDQFLYVSKARFGYPGPVRVLRNFNHQRFDTNR